MKIQTALFASHLVVYVYSDSHRSNFLLPQVDYGVQTTSFSHQSQEYILNPTIQKQENGQVSHVSHNLPGRSSMSITRNYRRPIMSDETHGATSVFDSSDNMSNLSGMRYPVQSQSGMHKNMPNLSSGSHNMASQTTTTYNMPIQRTMINNMPLHYGYSYIKPLSLDNGVAPGSHNRSSAFTVNSHPQRTGKSYTYTMTGSNYKNQGMTGSSGHSPNIDLVPQQIGPIEMNPISTERSNVLGMFSTTSDRYINYDYQSLTRDQVDHHVFNVIPHETTGSIDTHHDSTDSIETQKDIIDSIETDHSIKLPPDTFYTSKTNPLTSSTVITRPVINSNMMKHTNSVGTSETATMVEMVEHQSPMLTEPRSGGTPGPFAPRFQVPKWEISDSEWEEEIRKGFEKSNLVPGLIPDYPPGLVNINYGIHGCMHLGTRRDAETTSSPPRISFPVEPHRIYTFILLDVNIMQVNWMVINIPGSDPRNGQTIAEYQPPAPMNTYSTNQYVALALLQSSVINKSSLARYSSKLCELEPRTNFSLKQFMKNVGLELIVAANYFVVDRDSYVESIESYCHQFPAMAV